MKVKDFYGKEQEKVILKRLREFLNDESGFIFIFTAKDNKITDMYKDICSNCVEKKINICLEDAKRYFRLGIYNEKKK